MERRVALSVVEAAELPGVHPETVRRSLVAVEIPGRKVGSTWRIPRQALMDWLYGEQEKPKPR